MPTIALLGLAALVVAPVAVSLCMMGSPQNAGTAKKPAGKPATLAGFDGQRAYEYLVEQCQIGPRISGTEGNRTLRQRMVEHFESCGAGVLRQTFQATHPLSGDPVEMENIVASWHPERKSRVLIGAHFDTRPQPDKETDPRAKSKQFLGANDGASGVAVLMELANMLPDLKTGVGVDLVAFDGEELVYDEDGEYFLGSTHFAEEYRQRRLPGRYVAAIIVDMVGDKTLEIYPDQVSRREVPQLVEEIWKIARRLRAGGFKTGRSHDIRDDHLPLLAVGIPAIDIIDFDFGKDNRYWHTLEDKPERCSPASLAQVGGVLAEWLRSK
jgi:hypothetical protein